MSRIVRRPEVYHDLIELAEYIAHDSLDGAERFLDAAEATFEELASAPLLGGVCEFQASEAADVRVWQIHGFKRHLVFYRPTEVGVEIVRVIHAARDMGRIFGPQRKP